MRKSVLVLLWTLLAGPAFAQDAFRLDTAVMHGGAEVASWPIGVTITRVTMRPDADFGLSFDFTPRQSWPDVIPSTGGPNNGPWTGPLQYTVWACVPWNGQPHCGGFIQMWRDRPSTGAPILEQWNRNWAYDENRWGEMARYTPRAGDTIWFFLAAGNSRTGQLVEASLRQRSNVVAIQLPANDTGTFTFNASSPTVTPVPVQPSQPPVYVPPSQPVTPVQTGLSTEQWNWLVSTMNQIVDTQRQQRDAIADLTEWARAWRNASEEAHRHEADVLEQQIKALAGSQGATVAPNGNNWKDYLLLGLVSAIGIQNQVKK